MKTGIFVLNTTNPIQSRAGQVPARTAQPDQRAHRQQTTNPLSASGRSDPSPWSCDIAAAQYSCRRRDVDVISTGSRPTAAARFANDTSVVLKGAPNPLLAPPVPTTCSTSTRVMKNISFTAYISPLTRHPQRRLRSDPATQPDVHRGAALLLQAGGHSLHIPVADDALWPRMAPAKIS